MQTALLGSVVASTDAAAVFDMLRRAPVPPRLAAILKVESGANDPVAIALTLGLLSLWAGDATPATTAVLAVGQLTGGIVVGAAVGAGGVLLLRRVRLGTESLYPILALAVAGLAYGAAVQVRVSGFLAVYVAGLLVGDLVPRRRRSILGFHGALASGADIGLFLLLGLLVFPSRLPAVALTGFAVAAIITFVARPLAVALTMGPLRAGLRESGVVAWAGLRGAVPIVLSTFPYTAGHPEGQAIFDVVFFVVLVSTLVQGVTVAPLVRRLGIAASRPGWAPVAEALPLEGVDVDLVEVLVTPDLPVARQRLRDAGVAEVMLDAGVAEGMLVVAIVRGDAWVLPRGHTRILPEDLVLLAVQPQEEAAERATAWARGELGGRPPR